MGGYFLQDARGIRDFMDVAISETGSKGRSKMCLFRRYEHKDGIEPPTPAFSPFL